MGVENGGTGDAFPAQSKNQRGTSPPQKLYFSIFYLPQIIFFAFSTIFKIKWPKSEEKLKYRKE